MLFAPSSIFCMRRMLSSLLLLSLAAALAQDPAPPDDPAQANSAAASSETLPPSTNAAPYKIPEGRILEFPVALTPAARTSILNSKNPMVEFARGAIAVPPGFDRDIPAALLLVHGTSDGDASSVRAMQAYTNIALRMGWIVIAADGPRGKPPNDNPPWRWAMVSSLLEHMHKTWPGSRRWPVASVGVSGGGKWAGVIGGILAHRGYNVIGIFMGAVNEDYASETAKLYDPAVKFKNVPIFLSSGTDDKLATPQHHIDVRDSLLHQGFTTVRLETFKGGHALSELELRQALNWFMEQYGRSESPPPPKAPSPAAGAAE
jgi:hypothetical protein